jgi:gas vesicle protein
VSRPTNTVTQPVETRPVVNTQPIPESSRPSSPPRNDDDDRRRPNRDDDREEKHHSTGSKIKKFFRDIFNGPEADPSQLPTGQKAAPEPAPIDNKVVMDFKETAPKEAVAADDRSELIKLRPQPAIPKAWYEANGLNYEVAKQIEAEHYSEVEKLNNIFGYVSPSALWNQINKLARLTAKDIKSFKATISSVIVTVENTASEKVKNVSDTVSRVGKEVKEEIKELARDAYQAAVDVQARVKYSLGLQHLQSIETAKAAVVRTIGKPVYGEKHASNPYRSRHSKV